MVLPQKVVKKPPKPNVRMKKLKHVVMSGGGAPGEAEGEINGLDTEDMGMDGLSEHWWDGEIGV